LSDHDVPWEAFRSSVLAQLGQGRCRVGIGSVCTQPNDFPRSFREARFALTMQGTVSKADQAVSFDDLGVFRILAESDETASIERFVHQWLGRLLQYDEEKQSRLVSTLSAYLEAGGNYAATSLELAVHRSTLKYRLQRIREISGHDLSNADTAFNLQLACRAWQTLQGLQAS
jgi:DNA-binding PucR family transcriptional regulator